MEQVLYATIGHFTTRTIHSGKDRLCIDMALRLGLPRLSGTPLYITLSTTTRLYSTTTAPPRPLTAKELDFFEKAVSAARMHLLLTV